MPDFYNVGWSIPLFPPATEPTHTIWVAGDVIDFQMPPLTLAVLFHFPQTNQADTTATVAYAGNLLYDGVKQVNAGIGSPDNTESLIGGITAVDSGLQQLGASLPEAPQAIATQIKPGVDEMAAGLAANLPLIGSTVDDPDTLLYAAHALVDYLDMIQGLLGAVGQEGTIINDVSQVIAGLSNEDPQGLLQKLQDFGDILDGVVGELTTFGANDTIRGLVGISPTMAADEKQALFNKMDAVAADVQSVESGLDGAEGSVSDLLAKVNSVSGSLGLISFIIGSPETDPSLLYAAVAIEGGLKTLRGALSTGDPADPGLYEGLVQVSGGLDQLTSGLNTAVAGIGSAGTPDTLLYGTNALASGLTQLKNEVTMALEDGLHTLLATLSMTHAQREAITERGEEFDHFSDAREDADNQCASSTRPNHLHYKRQHTAGSWPHHLGGHSAHPGGCSDPAGPQVLRLTKLTRARRAPSGAPFLFVAHPHRGCGRAAGPPRHCFTGTRCPEDIPSGPLRLAPLPLQVTEDIQSLTGRLGPLRSQVQQVAATAAVAGAKTFQPLPAAARTFQVGRERAFPARQRKYPYLPQRGLLQQIVDVPVRALIV